MRMNINKIVAFAIGISVMNGSIMPAFAADNIQSQSNTTQSVSTTNVQTQINKTNVLTLDEAIKSAISTSDTLALEDKAINYQNKINDIIEKQDDFTDVDSDVKDFHNDKADIKLKTAKQQRDFDGDVLRKKVTDKYNEIVTSQMIIDKATKELEIKNKGLEDDKLTKSLGMTRLIDVKTTELAIQNLQNTQKTNQNKLNDLQYSFKVLTGKDLTQCSLEQDVKFEPLKIEGSIDEYLDNSIDSYVKYNEQLVKLDKDYYDKDYEDDNKVSLNSIKDAEDAVKSAKKDLDNSKDKTNSGIIGADGIAKVVDPIDYTKIYTDKKTAYTNTLAGRITYLTTKLGNYQDETKLNESKKQFKDSLKGYYTDLRASEDKINYDKKQIEVNNENLSNLKLKYDLGIITKSAYNTEVVNSEKLDLELRAEVTTYNITKEKLQKPWIAFSGAQ